MTDAELAAIEERARGGSVIPSKTAGNGPSGDDRASGGSRDGSASEIAARARAEAFEECARIADVEAETHRLRDDPRRMDAARWVAREIRRRAKT